VQVDQNKDGDIHRLETGVQVEVMQTRPALGLGRMQNPGSEDPVRTG
jgi:hypothetical protein